MTCVIISLYCKLSKVVGTQSKLTGIKRLSVCVYVVFLSVGSGGCFVHGD